LIARPLPVGPIAPFDITNKFHSTLAQKTFTSGRNCEQRMVFSVQAPPQSGNHQLMNASLAGEFPSSPISNRELNTARLE
jgi:hypothetical protein